VLARLLALLVSVMLLWPAHAEAADTDPAAAELLFQKGREAMVAEDYDAACQFFLESISLDQAVGTVMNLAVCEEKRGHLTASWERWHQALRLLEPSDDRVLFAEDQLTWISARLAHLTIVLSGASPRDVTIRRDGVALGEATLGQELPVDPGTHEVTVEGKRFETRRYSISLESGESQKLVVSPGTAKPEAAKDDPNKGFVRERRIAGFVALGVGVAGAATAVVSGLYLPGKDNKVESNCPNMVCNETGVRAISEAQTLLALNTAGWIAAGVGLAAGTTLLLTLPKSKKPSPSQRASKTGQDAEEARAFWSDVAVGVTPSGILLRGKF